MKTPSFLEGALVGLIAAIGASIAQTVLAMGLPRAEAFTLVVAGLGLAYGLYLLARSSERAGRLAIPVIWVVVTFATWALAPGPWTQIAVQSGLVWLVRSLYHQPTPLAAVLDGALVAIGLAAALWAGTHTASLLLASWCLFLVQALFVAIPDLVPSAANRERPDDRSDPFDLARRTAEQSLTRLAQRRAP